MKTVHVSVAIMIDGKGRILLAKRPQGKSMAGLWELPGGKIEARESARMALVRELQEELHIIVDPDNLLFRRLIAYSYPCFKILMSAFQLNSWSNMPCPASGQTLEWVMPKNLCNYPFPSANAELFASMAYSGKEGT